MTTDIIKAIEEAKEGSRELDARIAEGLGYKVTFWELNDHRSFGMITDANKLATAIPHYSTSLDAPIPGTEITGCMKFSGRWHAEATKAHKAVAATEPLARRAAELRQYQAMRGE